MTTKRHKPQDIADPGEFLKAYFRDRGIKRRIECTALTECIRRAEEARESFKLMRAPAVPALNPDATGALSDAQKYSRRLLNNRKSAAATRVYHEVLNTEQAHSLAKVVVERDQYVAQVARANADRDDMEREAVHLRALVKQLRAEKGIGGWGVMRDTEPSTAGGRFSAMISPTMFASSLGVPPGQSMEHDIVAREVERNGKSLGISLNAGEVLNLGLIGSQSSQETDPHSASQSENPTPSSSQELDSGLAFVAGGSRDSGSGNIAGVLRASQEWKEGEKEMMLRRKFPVGAAVRIGMLNSQGSQGAPINLRYSMASEDVEEVDEIFSTSQCQTPMHGQGNTPVKRLRRFHM